MTFVRTTVALVALSAGIGTPVQTPHPSGTKPVATVRPSETALSGTIDHFDPPQRQLVLQTKDGARVTFVVAADAIVWFGSRKLRPADIPGHRGRRAKVRYTLAEGTRTAHWVFISSEAPKSTELTASR